MRCLPVLAAFVVAASAAMAAETPDPSESITIRDVFAKGGVREIKPDWEEINKHPLGSEGNPVRSDMPAGERHYLSRLRCPGGASPEFRRDGSTGRGPYQAIMDVYTVTCPDADQMKPQAVFMDMYHPGYQEKRPVPGFTIVPPLDSMFPHQG